MRAGTLLAEDCTEVLYVACCSQRAVQGGTLECFGGGKAAVKVSSFFFFLFLKMGFGFSFSCTNANGTETDVSGSC